MRQCWDADPSKRPDIGTFLNEIDKLNLFYHKELEAFYSKSIDFNIPDNIDDFDKLNDQKNKKNTSKLCSIFKVGCKKLFKILKRNPKDGIQNDKKGKIICVTACVKTTRKKSKKSKEK
ncbi:unnamed protein product [Rhizophagus irregularis]|uniref:Serine-threonine/tyrosine-protein kinase catalytic domain-containing protein n=1 Tax=Rhizophagus irregularis TaxID=588596 RepID=A0A916EKI5_9GLOM|nr:unnamed protein product [Rhizophagus irregularis]CAB5390347.1 unnamed protein product [Rhizophagus irregularis]